MQRPNTPLLTICIPTYQRRKWLELNLTGILHQVKQQPKGLVEIVISENGGNDESWEYIRDLGAQNECMVLNRNLVNIGAEGNFYLLPKLATGDYLWLLGDDDFLDDGALAKIVDELNKRPDYLVVNFTPSDESLTRSGRPYWSLPSNAPVHNLRECCEVVPHFAMGFLSAWIALRSFFNRVDESTYMRFATWGLSAMVDRYVGIAGGARGCVLAESMLTTRKPRNEEYPSHFNYFEWFFQGSTEVFRFLEKTIAIDPFVIKMRKSWLLRKIAVQRILFERANDTINRAEVNRILFSGYGDCWEYWAMCLPALYFPGLGICARLLIRSRRSKS